MSVQITSDRPCQLESGAIVEAGTTVKYCGHVPGGMVRVRLSDGSEAIMHPNCFAVLRE
jgi:hypothetical protein